MTDWATLAGSALHAAAVAIAGSFDAWPRHRPLPRGARVRVKFGHPTVVHDRDGREIVSWIGGEFAQLLDEIERDDPMKQTW